MNQTIGIVVTYNRKEMLRTCLEKLLGQEGASCDVLVVDNGSTDGTEEAIRDLVDQKQVLYCTTGKNLGGAGGFNYGMRKAVEMGYTYVWAMDDDTYPEKDALAELLKADRKLNGQYGFLSSIAYWTDGSICNMNRQHIAIGKKLCQFNKKAEPVIMASFVAFFLKTETIRRVGLPISEFFIWSDDLEYSRRISKELPCYAVTESKVVHAMGSNSKVGIEHDSVDRLWRYQYLYRNECYVYRREGLYGRAFLFSRVILHTLRVLFHAREAKRQKLKTIWSSYRSGKKFYPPIEKVE